MKKVLNIALEKGAQKAEVYYQKQSIEEILFEDSKLKQVTGKNLEGISLSTVKDGKIGRITTSDFSQLDKKAEKAIQLAEFGDKLTYDFTSPADKYPELKLTDDRYFALTTEELISKGQAVIDKIINYDKDIKVRLEIKRKKVKKEICNTNGLDVSMDKYYYDLLAHAVLVDGDNFIGIYTEKIPELGAIDFDELSKELIERMKISRNTVTMESGTYPVIFTPTAVGMMTLAFDGFKGQNIAKKVSPIKDKLHTRIFNEKITIIDDGISDSGYASEVFDDEGTPMQRTVLVNNGVLENFIYNLESATELNVTPTGNALKNGEYKNKAKENFTNLYFSPGNVSLDEMIKDIKLGLVIEDISGLMMGNLLQGNIDSDMEMAYKIENGKIVGRVKNGAIGTNIYKVLNEKLVAVENRLTPINFLGCVYAPHILCKDIYISIG